MAHDLIIRPEAEADFSNAFRWYEDQLPGLGADYLNSMDASLNAIQRNPESFPIVHRLIRRCLIRRFPYAIFYTIQRKRIIVLAIFHQHRDPRAWKNRT